MFWTTFRSVTEEVFGLPGKPKVVIAVAFGPLVPDERRAMILVKDLEYVEPHKEHFLQRIDYAA